jgi:antirestriction protein ArdC
MDIYAEITNRMIHEMEQGIIPWAKPWMAAGSAISHTTGQRYSLLNQMLLGKPGEYATFKQVNQEGGYVKRGAKAKMVVFWKWLEQEDDETHEIKKIPLLRFYNVFHLDDCEGIKPKYMQAMPNTATADQTAESIIADYAKREGLTIEHVEGDSAYYQPASDKVVLPLLKQFTETAEYYGTAFHELVHSTGHMNRLARLDSMAFFGSEAYSKEELVAEIGSAALVHHVGLETSHSFRNSAAYLQNWLTVLKNDKRFIVSAAGKADKAVDFILVGR